MIEITCSFALEGYIRGSIIGIETGTPGCEKTKTGITWELVTKAFISLPFTVYDTGIFAIVAVGINIEAYTFEKSEAAAKRYAIHLFIANIAKGCSCYSIASYSRVMQDGVRSIIVM